MHPRLVVPLFFALAFCFREDISAQSAVWSQLPNSPSGSSRHDDIYMINETTGWTARGRAGIFKTSDGGNTWVQKLNKTDTHFRCISFVSAAGVMGAMMDVYFKDK